MESVIIAAVRRVQGTASLAGHDALAVEEPLEIRVGYGPRGSRVRRALSVTMRTPGHDRELAAGFLLTEGIVRASGDIEELGPCGTGGNTVRAELAPSLALDFARLERHFYTTSSCGVCGKSSIEALRVRTPFEAAKSELRLPASYLHRLPEKLRRAQAVFEQTGGLHASALFDSACELEILREDVGRHNALDKVIGASLLSGRLPLTQSVLLVSGRASFELVQKAAVAGIPVLAAIGAPSSLAVELAADAGMTLLGFLRDDRFNIYCGHERVHS
jgi:FdhD protein